MQATRSASRRRDNSADDGRDNFIWIQWPQSKPPKRQLRRSLWTRPYDDDSEPVYVPSCGNQRDVEGDTAASGDVLVRHACAMLHVRTSDRSSTNRQGLLFEQVPKRRGRRAIEELRHRGRATGPKLKGKYIALDVETNAKSPWHGGYVYCWAYFTELGEYGFMMNTPANLEWVRQLFFDDSKELIFHNAKFDLLMFLNEGIDIYSMKAKAHCTLILSKLHNENGEHGLQWLSQHILKRDTTDKTDIKDWKKANKKDYLRRLGREPDFTDAPIDMVKRRNIWDSESTLLLFHYYKKRIGKHIDPNLYETERLLQYVVIEMENRGIAVDISKARQLKKKAEADIKRIHDDLKDIVGDLVVRRAICTCNGKKKGKNVKAPVMMDELDEPIICPACGEECEIREELIPKEDFNPNSATLQLPAAWEKIGIPLKYKTQKKKDKKSGEMKGGGGWSFDEYAMIRYVSKPMASIIRDSGEEHWTTDAFYFAIHEAIKKHGLSETDVVPPLIMKYRELTKMVSTYYKYIIEESVEREVRPDGREIGVIHGRFNQSEALTGRFSSSEPNLQNLPRILGPRECFIPRRSRENWHFDFEQAEMRFFAHFSEDPDIIAAIEGDIHLNMAATIYNIPLKEVTSEQRKRVKAINFGILYGAGPAKMADTLTRRGIPTTVSEASKIVAEYHRRFPSIRNLTAKLKRELIREHRVSNPYGRHYHIPERFSYKALNYLCQGSSADLMKSAMVKIWQWLRARGLKSKILLTVHDELCIEIPPTERELVVTKVKQLMEDRESFFVPMLVDAKVVTHRWSKKYKPSELGYSLN